MKKITALLGAIILLLTPMTGCNGNKPVMDSSVDSTTTTTATAAGNGTADSTGDATETVGSANTTTTAQDATMTADTITTITSAVTDIYGLLKDIGDTPEISTPATQTDKVLSSDGKWLIDEQATFSGDHLIVNTKENSNAEYVGKALGDVWRVSTNFRPITAYPDTAKEVCTRMFLFNSNGDVQIILTVNILLESSQVSVQLQMYKNGWRTLYSSEDWEVTASTKFHMELSRAKDSDYLHFIIADEERTIVEKDTVVKVPSAILDDLTVGAFGTDHSATEFYDMVITGNGSSPFTYRGTTY